MITSKIHIYFVPGLAASPKIFEHISLDENLFNVTFLEWKIPNKKEDISAYANRMCSDIKEKDNVVLIGVSFGGIMVQEMSKFINCKKIIIISSVKNEFEMPKRFSYVRKFRLNKFFPTKLASRIDILSKMAFGEFVKNRIELYKKYLAITDVNYLNWSINCIINWKTTILDCKMIHIHGTDDIVFPIKNLLEPVVKVPKGTHVMIVNRFRWFNENLPNLILNDDEK